jgi:hypothetical protein
MLVLRTLFALITGVNNVQNGVGMTGIVGRLRLGNSGFALFLGWRLAGFHLNDADFAAN